MKNLVANFPLQLQEALNIAKHANISAPKRTDQVLITGLGGLALAEPI